MLTANNRRLGDENKFPLRNFKIVSLWEMERFYAEKFLHIVRAMERLKELTADDPICTFSQLRNEFLATTRPLSKLLKEIGFQMSLLNLEKTERDLKKAKTEDDFTGFLGIGGAQGIFTSIENLSQRIQDEFSLTLCFILNAEKGRLYSQTQPLLGELAQGKFPELATDISEAGKCFAVGRYTACVFHLMRIMEVGVQKLGVSFTGDRGIVDKDWQKILNAIRCKLNDDYPDKKDKARMPHESLIALLESVKNGWRNPTMHPKQTYTEEEAEDVLQAVKSFMRELAKLI